MEIFLETMILFISLQSGFYRVFCLIGLPDLLERCSSGLRGTPGKRVYPKRVSRVRISVFPLLFWRAGSFEPALFGSLWLSLALLIWLSWFGSFCGSKTVNYTESLAVKACRSKSWHLAEDPCRSKGWHSTASGLFPTRMSLGKKSLVIDLR